jgi:hypothetical protein
MTYNKNHGNRHNYADVDIELQIIAEIQALKNEKIDVIIRYVQSSKKHMVRNPTVQPVMQTYALADDLCKQARKYKDQTE